MLVVGGWLTYSRVSDISACGFSFNLYFSATSAEK